MADQPQGFWSSLQGILTALAGVITAITGLYIAINGDNADTQPNTNNVEVITPLQTQTNEASITADKNPSETVQLTLQPQTTTAHPSTQSVQQPASTKQPFPDTGPLVDCTLFPTVNTVASLMSWSNNYQKQIIAAEGSKRRATDPCNKTIDYRGMAHCKVPDDPQVRQALLETLTLCRAEGIEWQDIEHSSILGQE